MKEKVLKASVAALLLILGLVWYLGFGVNQREVGRAEEFLRYVFSQQGLEFQPGKAEAVKAYRISGKINGDEVEFFAYNGMILQPVARIPEELPREELPKADVPTVELFVMSYCPYGLQMEKALFPVLDLLGDKINFSLNYVIYSNYGDECLGDGAYCSMHGMYELEEDIRQNCVKEIYGKEKWLEYLKAFAGNCSYEDRECWRDVAANLSIDAGMLQQCLEEEKESMEWLAGQKMLNEKYGVTGSPTLVINGQVVRVQRSPEALKQKICEAFTNPPEECQARLSEQQTSPGFGFSSGSSAPAASCG